MAALTKEQNLGRDAYQTANKDIPDAPKWAELTNGEQAQWIAAATDADKTGNLDKTNGLPPVGGPETPAPGAPPAVDTLPPAPAAAAATVDFSEPLEGTGPPIPAPEAVRYPTLRDLAAAAYAHESEGDFEALSAEDKEKWEQYAKAEHQQAAQDKADASAAASTK